MSSSITIESLSVPISQTFEPEGSIQHDHSRHSFGPGVSLEMDDIPTRDAPPMNEAQKQQALSLNPKHRSPPAPTLPVDQRHTIWKPYMNRFRVLAACFTSLGNGMNDSASGALIESIEKYYSIGYGTVATIFLCNALGFIAAAFFVSPLTQKVGRAKCLILGEGLIILGYTIIATTPPFRVVPLSFFFIGIGQATNLAIGQVFCGNLANNTAIVGFYQGAYGIGGIFAPFIATSMVLRGALWSRFYLILLGVGVWNILFAPWAFWRYEAESDDSEHTLPLASGEQSTARPQVTASKSRWSSVKTLLTHKTTILGALFIFGYQGSEVAISGWVISFLVQFRDGDPSKVGYVTSGFWAGITLGRFTLSFLAHKVGERPFVFMVTAGALVLELLVWFVPSIPGDSVAVAFSGLLLGPVYPAAVHIYQKLIPRKMQIASLSLIGSIGSAGGALAPFMTGMIAQRVGTFVLHPICISLFGVMAVTWFLLPKVEKKPE